ncbi:hypothetical protein FIV06_08280 [Labrenzia sp. THAF191b]|uniref:DUF6615 family protein n=1 Tax=unclassified Labrenzia TaxID=2648686 RepID=UPI001269281C|nr:MULTISPECIES: DUF6615 family protein [unclassified Labrenzia]QFS97415.1 hypothetical protein FIV06_08280 [Labrenzia sp. THAF191b]QFT03730.1 hypothetical protein FIV05_08280 [Labrenzia sp. THAF191a]QFT15272.1 hypothetical protein FIV03_08285 [Labrenzia sp. THAF187b]
MSSLSQEQVFLLALSRMVWAKRSAAKSSRLPFNEETITETILLDLKTAYPGQVQVVAFNKAQEAKTGADWLWSFVNVHGTQSLTILVQAKRLEDAEQIYKGINRNIGKRTPPVRQIDQLLATARNQGVPALYAFYNHVTDLSRVPPKCQSLQSDDPNQVLGFGISLAEASAVACALPDESFDVHRVHSIPLHCLLCNVGQGTRPGSGTPERAASGLARLRLTTSLEKLDPDYLGLRRGLHPMVEFALRIADGDDFTAMDDLPDIAGVVILRDTNEKTGSDAANR